MKAQPSNPNLVIMATRDRPHNAVRAFEQLAKVSAQSDFLMIINQDQADLYPVIAGVELVAVPDGLGANGKANHVLEGYWDDYATITGIDDDCMVTTHGWDSILASPIKARGYGLSYGDDLIQGENLPTKVMISTNILKTLGFWAPPSLFHLYCDNFWKCLGQALDALDYFPDVKMEHWHHLNGKAPIDDLYREAYTSEAIARDRAAWQDYMGNRFDADVEKIKASL